MLRQVHLLCVVLGMLGAFTVHAEHEANHRYNVRGYVLDDAKNPIVDAPVSLRMDGKVVGSDRTDSDGHYSIRAHLHDSDIGKKLTVRAGEHRAEIHMQGMPGDLTTDRVHHVSFLGGEFVETELDRGGLPGWSYPAGALLLAGAGIVAAQRLRRRAKRLRRLQERQETAKNPKRKKKSKRKRRRR